MTHNHKRNVLDGFRSAVHTHCCLVDEFENERDAFMWLAGMYMLFEMMYMAARDDTYLGYEENRTLLRDTYAWAEDTLAHACEVAGWKKAHRFRRTSRAENGVSVVFP